MASIIIIACLLQLGNLFGEAAVSLCMNRVICVRGTVRVVLPLILFSLASWAQLHAQNAEAAGSLFKTIQALDTQLFDAYNHCDLGKFASLLDDDLEFYHDKTGLSRGREATVNAVKNNICGKVTRELVPGRLEVYPLEKYGAVEIGVHRFHHPGDAANVGEAKFIHLWQNKDGVWKVTRVISFDHGPVDHGPAAK